ncbi:flagellar basal body P-ring formation chaperone FlgA [Salinarimonas soli]|nr:flagellar basal body P-ring formation chaperone FlgA [Salinarimonas soli]
MPARVLRSLATLAALLAGPALPALADGRPWPVPTVTIYPGETIRDSIIEDREFPGMADRPQAVDSRRVLVGKVARRTLAPGQLIPINAVEDPKLVVRGTPVQVVFAQDGLVISALASPLQSGSVGEMVRARNIDSGLVVVGTVQADGTLRVGSR